ncbi:ATP-binding protein [Kitasatospora sp. NPDC051914]|uniref:ATP-binding protein n=1 Tax=Kitasatospora sp. NPDC051914 TaxID=3154945 RepID=UPI00344274B1
MNTALLPPPAPPAPHVAPAQTLECVSFTDTVQCVAEVRACARAFLTRAHLPLPLREDALLVISELVTNSVHHTHGPGSLHLANGPDGLDVDVSDTSRLLPQPRFAEPGTALDGRGPALVAALCDTVSVTYGSAGRNTGISRRRCRGPRTARADFRLLHRHEVVDGGDAVRPARPRPARIRRGGPGGFRPRSPGASPRHRRGSPGG